MSTSAHALRLGETTRIQIDLLRRLGRTTAIVVACVLGALAVETIQWRLTVAGSPIGNLSSMRLTIVGLLALAWGGALWRGEGPKNRQYFLSHPVDVSAHELSRVAAGAAWMLVALLAGIMASMLGAVARKDAGAFTEGVAPWIACVTGPLLIYCFVSTLATLTDRVAEVLILTYLLLILLIPLASLTGFGASIGRVFNTILTGSYGLRAAIVAPGGGPGSTGVHWVLSLFIWYGVAGGLMAAALWWRRGRLSSR
jgi:hypothetical protein